MIGRAAELAALADAFARGAQLVTLVGPAGAGKTTLAQAYVGRQGPADAWLDVAADVDPLGALADALFVLRGSATEVAAALDARGPTFVVLDRAEGALDGLAHALPTLVDGAPDTRWLVTSRARLGIAAEHALELGPLPVDEALALIEARASRTGTRAALEALVAATGGTPLALALAAGRLREETPDDVARSLSRRERSERRRIGEREGLAPRPEINRSTIHRQPLSAPTLRASIDAALDALPPALVHALAALAIFEGAFGPDAAAALLGAEAPSALDALRARALILRADGAAHRLHEEVRAAVHERGVGEAAHQRLARWLAEHAPGWAHDVHEGEPTAALRALAMHAGDLERALRGSLHRDPASAARIALGLDAWWLPRGPRDQHEAVLRQGLDAAQRADDPGLEVELQRAHARALFLRGRLEEARAACVAPLQAARRSGAVRQRIAIAHVASAIARELGDPGAARALAERTLEEARAIGERDAEVRALHNLACAAAAADQHTEARATFLAALALARDVGARRVEALCLANLAIVHEQLGELELARARCAQALAAFAALDDRLMRTKLRMREARLSIRAGALDEAARSLRAATLEATRSGDRAALLEGHLARAELHRARGQHAAARAEADEARALAQHLHARGAVREVEAFLAALAPIDPATSAHTITVAVDGSSFALDEGPTVELDRRPTLRRVLAALAARHAAGERGASVSDLVAAGWPGEKMSAESGAERVYASIGALRRLVLAAVLVRREDGYALEGRIELVEP